MITDATWDRIEPLMPADPVDDSPLDPSFTRPRHLAVAVVVHLPNSSWTAGEGVWKSQDSVCC
ncbi:hypothetical protein CP980_02085 [Streptomyces vinaceus]|uniref:Uncharacterized protein n=1 Tax=Streptomyces vinaceus TaxID=1960 RepID=A0A5J6IZ41_STRVI|nr:hypothetical protein [Streptomyces vinaceus]QEV44019.1 hypothetical protein CP980_02085 [Streptomyces vinaceus]GHE72482.1 hypothetical protein GCM10017778_67250 [Streptomyces vinaceus]